MFYSKTTGGFYTPEIHGARFIVGSATEPNTDSKIPPDAVEITAEKYAALLAGQGQGKLIVADGDGRPLLQAPPPPSPQEIIAQYTAAVQSRLDTFFQSRGYDGILSAATYATSSVLKFQAEGQYAVAARDATWAKCYEILAAVEGGTSPMPTEAELLAELPALVWPQ
jgi:hypothetical protein